jgi:tetratricopeptide (TPR) repeat protein
LERIRVLSRLFIANTTFQTYQDGLILLAGRKFKPSQEKFKTALNEEADNVEILMRMGQSTFLNGDRQKAVVHFKMARQLDPFDPEIRLWLGKALQSRGDTREALIELKEAYSYFKENKKENRGDLGKNSEAAAVWYSEALVSDGQTSMALRILTQNYRSDTSHVSSLLAATQLRMQVSKADLTGWKAVRKDLNLALKKLDSGNSFEPMSLSQIQDSLAFVQDKRPEIIKAEILGFLKQMDQLLSSKRS